MNAKRAAKLMQIAHYYGEEKQVCKLMEELADVVNVTEQIIQLFGLETDFKVARYAGIQKTLKRIREEEQANETRDEPARRNL